MKSVLLTIDLEEFVWPIEHRRKINKKKLFEISYQGLNNLLFGFNEPITFFSTIEFAKEYPEKIKALIKQGHEIGIHGKSHINPLSNLKEEKASLEKQLNCKFYGFRSPKFSKIPLGILKEAGFKYDSSIHPRIFSNQFFQKRSIKKQNDIIRIPVSVTPLLRLPISWIWFRNFGLEYVKFCTGRILSSSDYLMIYFHPWDFYDLSEMDTSYFYKKNTGNKAKKMLNLYIAWLKTKDVRFLTVKEYLDKFTLQPF